MKRGFFITFEGPEGSGKSSQVEKLGRALRSVQSLRDAQQGVFDVRDPGETELGRRLRKMLLDPRIGMMSDHAEALLFFAARAELMEEKINPLLEKGVVVCDRFHDSTIAYQGYGSQLDIDVLQQIGRWAIGGRLPDLTILLDLPSEIGFSRLQRTKDRMESKVLEFHQRVRKGYLELAKQEPQRWVIVDATQSPEVVHRQILQAVRERLHLDIHA